MNKLKKIKEELLEDDKYLETKLKPILNSLIESIVQNKSDSLVCVIKF